MLKKFEKFLKKDKKKIGEKRYFTKSAGAGAKCDRLKLGVDLILDVRGACVRRKNPSQLTPCKIAMNWHFKQTQIT